MNILVIGSGGREHALTWKLKQSTHCEQLYVAPGNAGTAAIAQNVAIAVDDFDQLAAFISDKQINMVVVGPELPLVKGIHNDFSNRPEMADVLVVGPDSQGAQLEGSKAWSKAFMQKHHIPTAQAHTFTEATVNEGLRHLETLSAPWVLKADGLAAGKGVVICNDLNQAKDTLKDMLLDERFGEAGKQVVIEEFLDGIEVSVFVLTDGNSYVVLPEAKDYKRIGDGDTGPNTGGMGAVSPVAFADEAFMAKVKERIIAPTIEGLTQEDITYQGFIFIGLMNVQGNPYVIEYNVRMGDPETQVVLPRLNADLATLLYSLKGQQLHQQQVSTHNSTAVTVVMASGGYPEAYEKGKPIELPESLLPQTLIFHAGTRLEANDSLVTNGGRVLAVTGSGNSIPEAQNAAYATVGQISWSKVAFRKDIGKDLMNLS